MVRQEVSCKARLSHSNLGIRRTMKAGILVGSKDIKLGDVPDPSIGPGEVLVESKAAGICGTDLHIFRGEFEDRVAIDPIISCHACPVLSNRAYQCLPVPQAAWRRCRLWIWSICCGLFQPVVSPAGFDPDETCPHGRNVRTWSTHIEPGQRAARRNRGHPGGREIGGRLFDRYPIDRPG